jgi:glycosyltransferase involved in cell wall biosynthesis
MIPKLGKKVEILVVDRGSSDKTIQVIKKVMSKNKKIQLIRSRELQSKEEAIKAGFAAALDSDLLFVMEPDGSFEVAELERMYKLLAMKSCDLVKGTRMIYPLTEQSMRSLNMLGNSIYSGLFSYLIGQRITDVLCDVRGVTREAYLKLKSGKLILDPLDLLLGAAENKLKIREIPLHYNPAKDRNDPRKEMQNAVFLAWLFLKGLWRLKILNQFGYGKSNISKAAMAALKN